MIVMKISDPDAGVFDGKFVVDYEPSGETLMPDGSVLGCKLEVTDDPEEAAHFASFGDALDYWTQADGLREDGEPNRPLARWDVCVEAI